MRYGVCPSWKYIGPAHNFLLIQSEELDRIGGGALLYKRFDALQRQRFDLCEVLFLACYDV